MERMKDFLQVTQRKSEEQPEIAPQLPSPLADLIAGL